MCANSMGRGGPVLCRYINLDSLTPSRYVYVTPAFCCKTNMYVKYFYAIDGLLALVLGFAPVHLPKWSISNPTLSRYRNEWVPIS